MEAKPTENKAHPQPRKILKISLLEECHDCDAQHPLMSMSLVMGDETDMLAAKSIMEVVNGCIATHNKLHPEAQVPEWLPFESTGQVQ